MGGGPVGLTLACELALAEISVVVLERLAEVDTTIKAGAINSPISEAFYRRGMLAGLVEAQRAALEKPARVGPGVDPGQVALMRPEPHAPALRGVLAELTGTVTAFFTKKISGVGQRYDLPGDHPLTGRSAPDLELSDGTRLAVHLHDGRGLLLDLADVAGVRACAAGYGDRVRVRTTCCLGRPGPAGLLVRPDGCTARAADSGDQDTRDELAAALRSWCGTPDGAAA